MLPKTLNQTRKSSFLGKALPIFSYLFHPVFISFFATCLYFLITDRYFVYNESYLIIIQVFVITILIPTAFFYLLISLGKVDSIMAPRVSQRKAPLMLHIILLSILITKNNIIELYYFFLGSIISSFIALLLVFFNRKASLHMIGMASLTTFCISCYVHYQVKEIVFLTILLCCNGLVASSRLYMKAHTIEELTIGYILGIISQLVFFWL